MHFDIFCITIQFEMIVQFFRKTPDAHINIKLDTNELDLTKAEAKAIYQEIKDYMLDKYSIKVLSLNITQVKEKYGIIERDNYNISKNKDSKQPKYTKE